MAGDNQQQNNIAFVDGQNLHMSIMTADKPWLIDLTRFRVYLKRKYKVEKAYYFLGFTQEERRDLYNKIQEAGFILQFREHSSVMFGKKKGNVDTDIVFVLMRAMYRNEIFGKVVLVSGDGGYKMMVDFLIEENKFVKILFPDQKRASSLYKNIELKYRADLGAESVRRKIEKRKGLLR